jgi:hypothetical protein
MKRLRRIDWTTLAAGALVRVPLWMAAHYIITACF